MAVAVSVIMPVYNCEKYLRQALQSVLSQSVTELEVIAVEDCSTDSSRQILLQMAEEDARIRPILNERNMGVSAARNRALAVARGEFVVFCDSDDIVPAGAYAAMLDAIGDRDVCIGAFEDVEYLGAKELWRRACTVPTQNRGSMFRSLFSVCCLWTKMMRLSTLQKYALCFDETMTIGEDVVFLANLATKQPTYAVIDTPVYCHYNRMSEAAPSLNHSYKLDAYRKHVECRERLLEICKEIPECRDYVYLEFSWDLLERLCMMEHSCEREDAFELFRDFMRGYTFERVPKLFKAKTGVPYEDFLTMSADAFFTYRKELSHREYVAAEFDCGMIGLRWIVRYFKGWLRFKWKRSYR